jgi:indolepyruvate decarboxylase
MPQETLSRYLLRRLKELGVRHIFGVPGDYNLEFVDQIKDIEGLNWIGNCNELNAAYAADGYARLNGVAALVTVFGVGELSAINGIAGAYAEQVAVISIVGMPSRAAMQNRKLVHHSLGDGDFSHFMNCAKEVTAAQTILDQENASSEIDRVLGACWLEKRPIYIGIPSDLGYATIDAPSRPLTLPEPRSDATQLRNFLDAALSLLKGADKPVVLAGFELERYRLQKEFRLLIEKGNFPVATLSMGKAQLDENHPQVIGIYNGRLSAPQVKEAVEGSDCLLNIGVKFYDSTTGGFTHRLPEDKTIELHATYARVGHQQFADVAMKDALRELTIVIDARLAKKRTVKSFYESRAEERSGLMPQNVALTQKYFWEQLEAFLKPGDVVIAETGTASYAASITLPQSATFIGQRLWASIGYALPALLGTLLAARERRHILCIGDGSFQVTAQELSTILRYNLKPIIIVINNDGYTVERMILGEDATYNDINMWRYTQLGEVLDRGNKSVGLCAATDREFTEALKIAEATTERLVLIEAVMRRDDAPNELKEICKLGARQYGYSAMPQAS